MAITPLSANNRDTTGKGVARKLRAAGRVPAVIYGHSIEPRALSIDTHEFEMLLEKVSYRTTVFELQVNGKKSNALVREIQRHPFKKEILHIDFQELVAGEKVSVRVPIAYVGTAIGAKEGGLIDQIMHELTIRVDPMAIPSKIEVDITSLSIGKSIHVGEVKVPAGAEILEDAGMTVCICAAPKEEVAPATPEAGAAAATEPEVLSKGKKEEEGEAAEAKA